MLTEPALYLAAALFVAATGQAPPAQVRVAPVIQAEVAPTIELVGTVRADRRTIVAAEVSGLLIELPVDLGDRVSRGQIIARLRDDVARFQLDEARAEVGRLTAEAQTAAAMEQKWAFEKKRIEELWETRRSSEKELNDARNEYAAACARSEAARQSVAAKNAMSRMMEDRLGHTEIRAPFDAVVAEKRSEVGQWLAEGGELVALVAINPARFRVNVPESAISFAEVGGEVGVRLDAFPEPVVGRIGRLSPEGDERAHTFPVEIDLPNPAGAIRIGMFGRAHVPAGPRQARLLVPKDAVIRRDAGTQVFVLRDPPAGQAGPGGAPAMPMAMPVPVRVVGEQEGAALLEADGLSAADRVVVRGNERLFGPTPAILMPDAPAANSQPAATTQTAASH